MLDLSNHGAAILVFAMEGCGACETYIPRLVQQAHDLKGQGFPFFVYQEGATAPRGSIPILLYDAASPDVDVQKLADRFGVNATPTTILISHGEGAFKCEGSLANNQVTWLLMMAVEANNQK